MIAPHPPPPATLPPPPPFPTVLCVLFRLNHIYGVLINVSGVAREFSGVFCLASRCVVRALPVQISVFVRDIGSSSQRVRLYSRRPGSSPPWPLPHSLTEGKSSHWTKQTRRPDQCMQHCFLGARWFNNCEYVFLLLPLAAMDTSEHNCALHKSEDKIMSCLQARLLSPCDLKAFVHAVHLIFFCRCCFSLVFLVGGHFTVWCENTGFSLLLGTNVINHSSRICDVTMMMMMTSLWRIRGPMTCSFGVIKVNVCVDVLPILVAVQRRVRNN